MAEPMRPEVRGVAELLGRWGFAEGVYVYGEDDALEWIRLEAGDVYDAVQEGRDPIDVLIDTGWWREDHAPFAAERRDELIKAAI